MKETTEKTAGSNLTAIAEYTETARGLAELRQKHQCVVYDVTVAKEMKAAKEARAELRTLRVTLEKKRVEIKAPALERCRLIDAEAKQLTAQIVELEEPIDVQIKREEARAEEARLAKLEAERQRVEAIQQKIQAIRNLPGTLVGKPSVIIAGQLAKLEAEVLDEDEFAEHFVTARDALDAAIARVKQQLADQQSHEAEQRKIAAERAELERIRAENDRLQREADERAAADRAEADRKAQAEHERIAAEQRAKHEAERAERQRAEDEARAAREAQERAEREAREAELAAERERQAAEQKRLDDERAELERQRKAADEKAEADRLANLGLREAAEAASEWFAVNKFHRERVAIDLAAALANDAAQAVPPRAKKAANA